MGTTPRPPPTPGNSRALGPLAPRSRGVLAPPPHTRKLYDSLRSRKPRGVLAPSENTRKIYHSLRYRKPRGVTRQLLAHHSVCVLDTCPVCVPIRAAVHAASQQSTPAADWQQLGHPNSSQPLHSHHLGVFWSKRCSRWTTWRRCGDGAGLGRDCAGQFPDCPTVQQIHHCFYAHQQYLHD